MRRLRADFLVDDSTHHREAAERFGLEAAYIVVPAYGSPDDAADPLGWVRLVEAVVSQNAEPSAAADRGRRQALRGVLSPRGPGC